MTERIENDSFPVYVKIELVDDLQQRRNENYELAMRMEGQISRFHNELSVRMDRTDQVLLEHTEWHNHQADVNDWLTKQVKELREKRLRQQAYFREQMNESDNTAAGTDLVEQSQQQPREKCFRTAIGPGSPRNAPNGSGDVQSEKRPCPICGRLLSAKYLRIGKHQKTKQCKKAAEAAVATVAAVLREQEPECPYVISDVRNMDGDPLYCSEEDDETPGDLQVDIE